MNMHIGALQQHHENWKAARERLFNPSAKMKISEIVDRPAKPSISVKVPQPVKIPPMWTYAETHFDWHVKTWHEYFGANISRLVNENAAMRVALRLAGIDSAYLDIEKRSVKEICDEVLKNFPGITRADIDSHHRTKDIIYPRHLCFHAVVEARPDLSFPVIGRLFGERDHTTIIHGHRKISEMTEADHRKHLAQWWKCCRKRRKYSRERIMEIEAIQAASQ